MVDVWSPIFTMMMFRMTNLRSALFRVPFLQFSHQADDELRDAAMAKRRSAQFGPPGPAAALQNVLVRT